MGESAGRDPWRFCRTAAAALVLLAGTLVSVAPGSARTPDAPAFALSTTTATVTEGGTIRLVVSRTDIAAAVTSTVRIGISGADAHHHSHPPDQAGRAG